MRHMLRCLGDGVGVFGITRRFKIIVVPLYLVFTAIIAMLGLGAYSWPKSARLIGIELP